MVCLAACFAADFMNLNESTKIGRVRFTLPVTRIIGGCSSVSLKPTTSGAT